MVWTLVVAFVGAFAGSLLANLLPQYVIEPLRNRSEHKRLLGRVAFRQAWGSNPLAFFINHKGFRRS